MYILIVSFTKTKDKVEITNINLRKSFHRDLIEYHIKYGTPYDLYLFKDNNDNCIPVSHNGFKTKTQAKEYVDKLKKMYDVNYYEITADENLKNISFESINEIEKIIRIIPLRDNKKYKNDNLELGIITINLSDVILPNGKKCGHS